jgi:hypothetical protein
MAGIIVPNELFIMNYKGHKFFESLRDPDAPYIHYDHKGRRVYSDCYNDDEAMSYVDNLMICNKTDG